MIPGKAQNKENECQRNFCGHIQYLHIDFFHLLLDIFSIDRCENIIILQPQRCIVRNSFFLTHTESKMPGTMFGHVFFQLFNASLKKSILFQIVPCIFMVNQSLLASPFHQIISLGIYDLGVNFSIGLVIQHIGNGLCLQYAKGNSSDFFPFFYWYRNNLNFLIVDDFRHQNIRNGGNPFYGLLKISPVLNLRAIPR